MKKTTENVQMTISQTAALINIDHTHDQHRIFTEFNQSNYQQQKFTNIMNHSLSNNQSGRTTTIGDYMRSCLKNKRFISIKQVLPYNVRLDYRVCVCAQIAYSFKKIINNTVSLRNRFSFGGTPIVYQTKCTLYLYVIPCMVCNI